MHLSRAKTVTRDSWWMQNTKNTVVNCVMETSTLTQDQPDAPIVSILGTLGKDRRAGHAIKNKIVFVWETAYAVQSKNCTFSNMTQGKAYIFQLENNRMRIRDAEHQMDFIVSKEPAETNCKFPSRVYTVVAGYADVFIAFNYTREEPSRFFKRDAPSTDYER